MARVKTRWMRDRDGPGPEGGIGRVKDAAGRLLLLGIFLLLWAASHPSPSLALEIRIKDQATVDQDTVYLRDIAAFHPAGDARVKSLGGMEVASAPAPGNVFRLNRRFLQYKIGSAISGEEQVSLEAPEELVIQRAAQVVSTARMEEIFRDHVRGQSAWPGDKLTFERINAPEDVALPQGRLFWEIQERSHRGYLGNVGLVIDFYVDGRLIRKVPV
ncbi:MAG: hypothetical protein JW821_07010, partial [Deltaproteobacteria bacterium]|nr:hypothetical protein [Deltaproteobacteria bacterium]